MENTRFFLVVIWVFFLIIIQFVCIEMLLSLKFCYLHRIRAKFAKPNQHSFVKKHFHWLTVLFWLIRFDITLVSIGNNGNVKPNWPDELLRKDVKSNLIGQNDPVNESFIRVCADIFLRGLHGRGISAFNSQSISPRPPRAPLLYYF